jgi:hypothetical protein
VLPYRTCRARTTRGKREPPSDAYIERGLRERALSDPRAAEILLRWLQRPRAEDRVGGVDLDSMSERDLQRVYAGFLKVAAWPDEELRALVGSLLTETEEDELDCVRHPAESFSFSALREILGATAAP